MIYDAATNKPTQARIRLRDALIAASRAYEQKTAAGNQKGNDENKAAESSAASAIPASFNPIFAGMDESGQALFRNCLRAINS